MRDFSTVKLLLRAQVVLESPFSSYGVKNLEALNDDGVGDVDSMTTYYSQYAHTIYTKCYFALAKKPPFAYE